MAFDPNQNNNLENLAQLFLANNQQTQDAGPRLMNIGNGTTVPDNRVQPLQSRILPGLNNLAQGYVNQQTLNKKNQFMQEAQSIIQQNQGKPDAIAEGLLGLHAKHGTDYGLGIKDIVDQYGKIANRTALMNVYGTDESGNIVPKGQVPKGSRMVTEKAPVEEISAIGDAVINGDQPPDLRGLYGKSGAVRAYLQSKGFNLTKANRDWMATNKYVTSLNAPQQVRLNQTIDSVSQGIPALRDLSGELQRTDFNPSNYVIVKGQQNGIQLDPRKMNSLNPDQRQVAVKYVTQINLLRDEGAQVFSGGYAPQESAFKLIDEILNPYYSNPSTNAALDQLEYNLKIRKNAITNGRPMSIGGEVNVPGTAQNPEVVSRSTSKTVLKATNPQTNQKIQSFDGGQTWQAAQ